MLRNHINLNGNASAQSALDDAQNSVHTNPEKPVPYFRYVYLAALFLAGFARAAEPDGKVIYVKWCGACHDSGFTGALALQAKYKGSKPAVLTERTDLEAPVVKVFVRKGGSAMPFFRKTEINDAELGALASYLSAGRGVK